MLISLKGKSMTKRPFIGITMGDPAGIGPEIIVKALTDQRIYSVCRPVVLGDSERLTSSFRFTSEKLCLNPISNPADALSEPGKIDLLALSRLDKGSVLPGVPTIEGGKSMVKYILKAIEMAQNNSIGAMVTCPISKVLMHEAGFKFDGHTQLIAHETGTKDYVMMLAGAKLRVTLVTIHCALKDVPGLLTIEDIMKTITITADALKRDFGIQKPKIAVTALNPHAGESGLFGQEEADIILPAIQETQQKGYAVEGPFPADTLFYRAVTGAFDAVVTMYHDQGLIPLKLLHFSDGVNITLGLPIIRTSVDHGTAYDIAGKGTADPSSLKSAIYMAAEMAKNREHITNE